MINFKHLKYLPFKPTSEIIIKNTFNTQAPLKLIKNFNPFNSKSYNIKITTKVYDLFKKSQKIHLFFLKKDNLNWIMNVMNNNNTKDIKSYKLKFDNEGKLKTNSIKTVYTYFINSKKKTVNSS
ncbi:hypothetical protein HIC20_01590 [Buchnera aphidicola (Hormaphis cornu)]|nr:hypothetical protein HIC20_01590 [Buchnera aphidicola (Hormaphis cornu)]